jgi:hypothetical protein
MAENRDPEPPIERHVEPVDLSKRLRCLERASRTLDAVLRDFQNLSVRPTA